MLFEDTYNTIEKPVEGDYRDRGSRFIAYAYPLTTEVELKEVLAGLKTQHPKANHHCWALRLTTDRSVFKLHDDGEPAGTAGRPILNTLLSKDLTNIAVIVVRYFGGTLLGVPGLINAYKTVTELALSKAVVIQRTVNDVYTFGFDYLQINDVMRIIKDDNLLIRSQELDNNCSIQVEIRKTQVNRILAKIDIIGGVQVKFNFSS